MRGWEIPDIWELPDTLHRCKKAAAPVTSAFVVLVHGTCSDYHDYTQELYLDESTCPSTAGAATASLRLDKSNRICQEELVGTNRAM